MPEAATLSSSEAVRDRESVEAPEREPARESESKVEAPRSAFGDVSERVRSTMDEYRAQRGRISAGERDYATELAPAIQAAQQAIQSRVNLPAPPAAPQLKPPPSRKLTEFLSPVEGEAPEQSVSKMMQALGQLAMGLGVGGKRDARAALAAWSGALKGWPWPRRCCSRKSLRGPGPSRGRREPSRERVASRGRSANGRPDRRGTSSG